MKSRKIKSILALLAVAALTLSACGGSNTSSDTTSDSTTDTVATTESGDSAVEAIKAAGKITMVTNAEFPPFEYKDADEIIGIDAEIAAAIAEELGVDLEITDIAFDSCIPSVTEGKADFAAAGMTVTEDRLMSVDFTENYFNASQVIIVADGSDIKTGADLEGKIVGVQQGTTGDLYVTDESGENAVNVKEVKRYPKGMDAVSDLITGRIDCVVIDNFPAQKLVASANASLTILEEPLTEEQYAIAVAKGSDLVDEINAILKKLADNGKLDEIFAKYIED